MKVKLRIRLFGARLVRQLRWSFYRLRGYNLGQGVIVEKGVLLDKIYPSLINIGENTLIARNVVLLSHDHHLRDTKNNPRPCATYVGRNCLVGIGAIILPGTTIGDECIVAAGCVAKGVYPSNVIIAGNPAKVVRTGINMNDKCELI